MGGAVSAGEDNDDLIDNLLEADYIKSPDVERVFRAVDRAHYFTSEFRENAYKDLAWKSGNLHLSAPCIYSEVMESLQLSPGLSFLNLGSGTGYLSTMAGLILGPYGTNHGVEIHEDVVTYANKKLEEFRTTSPALDEYEFCEPKFVKGNCLSLNSGMRQYDRVYCGAACPENHENYMKNLIKVGGVLVMPLNDQLLQIVRTSETTWDVKSVLPVSFASLLLPDVTDIKETIKLPDSEPISLQDACRTSIRTILRHIVELEHPNLKTRRRRQPKTKRVKKRALRRLVIPIFEESDNDEFGGTGGTDDDDVAERDLGRASVIYDVQRQSTGQITAVIELARSLAGQGRHLIRVHHHPQHLEVDPVSSQDDDDDDDDADMRDAEEEPSSEKEENDTKETESNTAQKEVLEEASASSTCIDEQRKKIPKREKFDSGIGEDIENGKGLSSDSDREESMDVDSDSDFSDTLSTTGGKRNCLERDRTTRPTATRRLAPRVPIIWKRLAFATEEESDERSEDEEANKANTSTVETPEPPAVEAESYTTYMRSKIQALPLPPTLKAYINLYREF